MTQDAFGGENAESYYDEGLTASMKGELERAAEYFQKAIHADSSMANAYHQLGKCQSRLGRHKTAVHLLAQVVHKRPTQTAPRIDLGMSLIHLNRLDAAREQFEAALQQEPTNVKAMLGMAQADFHEGNWDAALAQAQAAHINGGNNFSVLFMLGRVAKLKGDVAQASKMLEKADAVIEKYLEMNPGKPEGHFLRGEVAYVQDNFASALEHYRAAEDQAKPDRMYLAYGENFSMADCIAKQGVCMQRLEKPDRARELGERVLALDPEHKLGLALRDS